MRTCRRGKPRTAIELKRVRKNDSRPWPPQKQRIHCSPGGACCIRMNICAPHAWVLCFASAWYAERHQGLGCASLCQHTCFRKWWQAPSWMSCVEKPSRAYILLLQEFWFCLLWNAGNSCWFSKDTVLCKLLRIPTWAHPVELATMSLYRNWFSENL